MEFQVTVMGNREWKTTHDSSVLLQKGGTRLFCLILLVRVRLTRKPNLISKREKSVIILNTNIEIRY